MRGIMRIIDQAALDRLSAEARNTQRLRKNLNLHESDELCCHRLFNAIEPGSYILPHRHQDPLKDETMVVVRGRMGVIFFDDSGNVNSSALLVAAGDLIAVDIPHGMFHTVISLESGTVFFESKAGPYRPLGEDEKGGWAPPEGSMEASSYLAHLVTFLAG
jgi:cupin fold WbuC family metalloprotein